MDKMARKGGGGVRIDSKREGKIGFKCTLFTFRINPLFISI